MPLKFGGKFGAFLLWELCKRPADLSKTTSELDCVASELAGEQDCKLERRFGPEVWTKFPGKTVIDFGCGWGEDTVAAAIHGAKLAIGIDIQEHRLVQARALAASNGVGDRCLFLNAKTQAAEIAKLHKADVVYSIDAFEHFDDPKSILDQMFDLLKPGGRLMVAFGPPWKNPYGSHMGFMSSFPWIHLLFTEEARMSARARYRPDGARRFAECAGGLNGMTVRGFRQLVAASGFEMDGLRTVPLSSAFRESRGLWTRLFNAPWLVEYCTSLVLAELIRPLQATSTKDKAYVPFPAAAAFAPGMNGLSPVDNPAAWS